MTTNRNESLLRRLDAQVEESWAMAKQGPFWRHAREEGLHPVLGLLAFVEQYHLVRHNSINQAVAAFRVDPDDEGLLKWCYRHAREELGHEKMITADFERFGVLEEVRPLLEGPPLPATQALIGYLYHVALSLGAHARLGYSYWAEECYGRFAELFGLVKREGFPQLGGRGDLTEELSFFREHIKIDTRHAEEVRRVLLDAELTPRMEDEIVQVARTTIYMQNAIFDNALQQFMAGQWSAAPEARAVAAQAG